MVLKEAFANQNIMKRWIQTVGYVIADSSSMCSTKQVHMKSKSYSDAADEEMEVDSSTYFVNYGMMYDDKPISPNQALDFFLFLNKEKEKLSEAISKAKRENPDIDAMLEVNSSWRGAAEHLVKTGVIRSSEKESVAMAYKMDNDGKQVEYRYPVKTIKTINFDCNKLNAVVKKINKECKERSYEVDKIMSTVEVPYESIIDFDGDLTDAVKVFIESHK